MFITKKHLSRRTFMRGVGVTLALPLMESMVPAQTPLAQTAARPVQRYGFLYHPMGSILDQWTPKQSGAGFEFSPILKPLEPFADQVNVFTGLYNKGAAGHSPSSAMFLSGAFPAKGNTILLNTTVDQVLAQNIGQETTFPSMEFATEDHSHHLGSCAGDFLCSYMSTVSWRTPTQPLPMEINPRVVFERMFGGDGATPEARTARLQQNTSILDAVAESVSDLRRNLGPRDQAKLTEYVDNVREIERRITQGERQRSERSVEAPATPVGVPESWEDHANLLWELQALALQADLTRVTSFMVARELSTLSYPTIGVADGHHPISHNNNVPEQVAKKAKVDTFHLELFAKFLSRLQATPDGDGNILDHSLFLFGSGMSNGNQHNHERLPIVTVGGKSLGIQGHRHHDFGKDGLPLSNLHLAIIDKAGIPMDSFGRGEVASTGRIEI